MAPLSGIRSITDDHLAPGAGKPSRVEIKQMLRKLKKTGFNGYLILNAFCPDGENEVEWLRKEKKVIL